MKGITRSKNDSNAYRITTVKYSFFIGQYQKFHLGHETIIRKVLDEGNVY